MISNVKTDIIYYSSPSDFELEFNLGGHCRNIRLLTDKVTTKKELIHDLARAVSRSRVTICCGPLFSDNGLIKLVSSAIGKTCTTINKEEYKIDSSEDIEIISGSVPLITPEQIFGGCIIESGNQAIILLTENRVIRKSIMQNLIHPYMEEICRTDAMPKEIRSPETPVSQEEPEEEITVTDDAAQDPASVEVEEEKQQDHTILFDMDDGQEDEIEEKLADEEQEQPSEEVVQPLGEYTAASDEDGRRLDVPIIVLTVMLILLLAVIAYLLVGIPLSQGRNIGEYVREMFEQTMRSFLRK